MKKTIKEIIISKYRKQLKDKLMKLPQYVVDHPDIKGWCVSFYDVMKLLEEGEE